MALQNVTIHLPEMLYSQVQQRARRMRRSVEEEVVAVVASALPSLEDLPADISADLAQLPALTDDELWQVAGLRLSARDSERMQSLMTRRQEQGLSDDEQVEAERLAHRFDRTMLLRAQAAVLLKERGYDISRLGPHQ